MNTKLEKLLNGGKGRYSGDDIVLIKELEPCSRDNIIIVTRTYHGLYYSHILSANDVEENAELYRNRTIHDGLKEGDIIKLAGKDIINKYKGNKRVLGICGDVIFLSLFNKYDEAAGGNHTLFELINMGYTLVTEEILPLD